MFFINLKYVWRSFKNDKTFAFINLFGMTAGITVALLTGFYVYYQLSYDKFIKDHDRIFRLEYTHIEQENTWPSASCSSNLAKVLKEKIPGIQDIMIIQKLPFNLGLKCDEKPFGLEEFLWVTPNFLDYYNLEFIYGSQESCLQVLGNMLITESIADKYFPGQNPVGKKLMFQHNDVAMFEIAGVIKEFPANSHIKTKFVSIDFVSFDEENNKQDIYDPENLTVYFEQVYLILDEHTPIDKILNYFPAIKQEYMVTYLGKKGFDLELNATNIAKMHFKQGLWNDFPSENFNSIYYFLVTAFVVILISILNFINLTLARFAGRNIDIGIRKIIGATKLQILRQYLTESYIFIFVSFVIALAISYALLPSFTEFNDLDLAETRFSITGLFWLIPILILVGFISGIYPALVSSAKYPQYLLRNKGIYKSRYWNRFFLIFQLLLSIVFFLGTIVIFLQLQYTENKAKGYDLDNVIIYSYPGWGPNKLDADEICKRLKESSYINEVAVSSILPGQDIYKAAISVELSNGTEKINTALMYVDHNYLPFADINLVYGRNFNYNLVSDSAKVIVNATFARTFSTLENAIGSHVYIDNSNEDGIEFEAEIIGIVSDFHFQSMHHEIIPMVISYQKWNDVNYYHIKYHQNNLEFVLKDAQKVFDELAKVNIHATKKYFPEEELNKQYEADKHLSEMTIWLSILSIVLAILGVFGLTAFQIRNNMKMLCIRKLFGASTNNIFKLLLKEYLFIKLIANIIALPLAWYICTKWLERFSYRISFSAWLLVTGIVMSVLIIITAISYHVWMISKTDPVIYLKDE